MTLGIVIHFVMNVVIYFANARARSVRSDDTSALRALEAPVCVRLSLRVLHFITC